MAGEFNGGGSEASSGKEQYKGLLGKLKREELLELLSEGFCEHCQSQLQTRIQNLNKKSTMGENIQVNNSPLESSKSKAVSSEQSEVDILVDEGVGGEHVVGNGVSRAEIEQIRCLQVGRKKDFTHMERVNGTVKNVLQGLELYTRVLNAAEQKKIVECVYELQRMGRSEKLRERTYTEPRRWMRGKGRVNIQFGCCYNYAVDKNGNPPGIIRDEEVDPLPPLFKLMIKRLVRWHILPATCIPNSCIVNIYDEGDCIPPHIDHHDFLRPFCTVSFLTECNILFGSNLKIVDAGEFSGPVSIPLPLGSVLILNGNGADVARHCVPAVPGKRISITFRRMDDSKLPFKFSPDPDLERTKPLVHSPLHKPAIQLHKETAHSNVQHWKHRQRESETAKKVEGKSFLLENDGFPSLTSSLSRVRVTKGGRKQ